MAGRRKARDYAAEYAARQERARRSGFTSYHHLRRYLATESKRAVAEHRPQQPKGKPHGATANARAGKRTPRLSAAQTASAHYAAFKDPFTGMGSIKHGEPPTAAIKFWYVNVLGKFTSEEWDEKYGAPHR